MYRCKNWTIKKAECWRIDAFELWCWRRLLRVPWTTRRANQSILKEISPEYSLEGLMLKLKLQYFDHLMQRTDSLEKTLMLGKIEGEEKGMTKDEMVRWHHWLDGHEFEKALGVGDGQGNLVWGSPWRSLIVVHDCATSLPLFTFMHWRRKWQPTPVFLPGESQGRGSLVGCRLWGLTESDTTDAT